MASHTLMDEASGPARAHGGPLELPAALPQEWAAQNLRPEIALSWWRSKIQGVRPELAIEGVGPTELLDADERLRRSLRPILDDLEEKLAGTTSSILLADHRAVIIDRRWTSKAVQATLDQYAVMPAYDFSEASVGTNAVGTAVEERRLVRVAGSEHYAEILKSFSCFGVPLVHPLTRRLTGVLDLTFPPSEEHPLMVPFIVDAGRKIETMLAEWSSQGQRAQFDLFLALGRRKERPVLSLIDDAVLLNRAARGLHPIDQATLVQAAEDVNASQGPTTVSVPLSCSEDPVSVTVYSRSENGRFPGIVLEVAPGRRRRSATPRPAPELPGLIGSSSAWSTLCSEAAALAPTNVPILISGEAGSGKMAVARALHELSGRKDLVVLDAATFALDGRATWFERFRSGLQAPLTTVVIRRLHQCDPSLAAAIAADLDQECTRLEGRLIATCTDGAGDLSPGAQLLLDRFCARLEVPPLTERTADIPALAQALLARRQPGTTQRFHPTALAALRAATFPENVRTLERVVSAVATRRSVGDVLVTDLPPLGSEEGPAHLTPMERAERDAIVKALRTHRGNKAATATALGISRPTLYRKLTMYRIDSA